MLEFGKDVVLASESEGWLGTILKPVTFVCANRPSFRFWVIEGTAIAGYNSVFAPKAVMEMMVFEGCLALIDEEEAEPVGKDVKSLDELKSVITEDGDELYFGYMELDEDYVKYDNVADDLNTSEEGVEEDEPEVRVVFDLYMPGGLNARERAKWKIRNLLTRDEAAALFYGWMLRS